VNMMKRILCLALLVVLLAALVGCKPSYQIYDEKDFIGLTSKQIEDKYGTFDHEHALPDDGGFRSTFCGYIVREKQVGYLGTEPPEYFLIYFDENGIAYKCTYELGGWGG